LENFEIKISKKLEKMTIFSENGSQKILSIASYKNRRTQEVLKTVYRSVNRPSPPPLPPPPPILIIEFYTKNRPDFYGL
jgi:hypothetical protein